MVFKVSQLVFLSWIPSKALAIIGNLPNLSSIIEKLFYARFDNFILKLNVFNQNQFGIQLGKSSDQAIIRLLDTLYESFNKNQFKFFDFVDNKKKLSEQLNITFLSKTLTSSVFRLGLLT